MLGHREPCSTIFQRISGRPTAESCSPAARVLDRPLYTRLLLDDQPIFPSTTAFTRRHLDRIGGFDERLNRTVAEDLEFTLRCVREAPIGVLALRE